MAEDCKLYVSTTSFCCQECGKSFSLRHNLKKHVLKFHPSSLPENSSNLKCNECEREFKKLYLLQKHKRTDHTKHSNCTYHCTFCESKFDKKSQLCSHFELSHEILIKEEKLDFPNFQEFLLWKKNLENETKAMYKKDSSTKEYNGVKYYYFSCHRSGHFNSRGNGLRHLKFQGSCKINGFCPAALKAVEDANKCSVIFISTHVGHANELGHLHLTTSETQLIASKIAAKIPFDTILDEIRDSISEVGLERYHLLTKKDLHNIENTYSLKSVAVRHQEDGTSVEAWVNLMKGEKSCVLFYKPQGVLLEEYTVLNNDDFVLIIMTDAQGEMLQRFGSDCVCMDGTHGLNSYGFELITLLVLDDMRQGFPGAFLISNRADQEVIAIFLSSIKNKIGELKPQVFMSDMAESFYNAWIKEMGMPKLRLFCTWHVDRAWRKNLSKISGTENQAFVYKILRTLLEERDPHTFEQMLASALAMLHADETTKDYAAYFDEYYAKCSHFWAFCYRLHSGLNTNMHIERMHKTIKYIYLQGKNVKRLDKAIHAIMQFVRDKIIDRLIILNKGKLTSKITMIRKRHKMSLKQQAQVIANENGWTVLSSDCSELYTIYENVKDCKCQLICKDCNTCLHQYSCSCIDSSIKWNMCKHIHALCKFQIDTLTKCETTFENVDQNLLIDEKACETQRLASYIVKPSMPSSNLSFIDKKENLKKKYADLIDSLQNSGELDIVLKSYSSLQPTIDAFRSNAIASPFIQISKGLATKNVQPQRRLYSTKKPRLTNKSKSITLPTTDEKQSIALSLVINNIE